MANDVRFLEEEQLRFPRGQSGTNAKGMAGWLMKKGWVKSPNQAKVVLFVIVIIGFAITFYNLSSLMGDGAAPAGTPPEFSTPPV